MLWIAEVANHERILSAATTTATGYGSLSQIKRGPPAAVNNPAHPSPLFWPQYAPNPATGRDSRSSHPARARGRPVWRRRKRSLRIVSAILKSYCGGCGRSCFIEGEISVGRSSRRSPFRTRSRARKGVGAVEASRTGLDAPTVACSISTKPSASRNPFGIGLRKRHARHHLGCGENSRFRTPAAC